MIFLIFDSWYSIFLKTGENGWKPTQVIGDGVDSTDRDPDDPQNFVNGIDGCRKALLEAGLLGLLDQPHEDLSTEIQQYEAATSTELNTLNDADIAALDAEKAAQGDVGGDDAAAAESVETPSESKTADGGVTGGGVTEAGHGKANDGSSGGGDGGGGGGGPSGTTAPPDPVVQTVGDNGDGGSSSGSDSDTDSKDGDGTSRVSADRVASSTSRSRCRFAVRAPSPPPPSARISPKTSRHRRSRCAPRAGSRR